MNPFERHSNKKPDPQAVEAARKNRVKYESSVKYYMKKYKLNREDAIEFRNEKIINMAANQEEYMQSDHD